MIVRFKLKLSNSTAENWAVWINLESDIEEIIIQHKCVELSREYNEVNFEKVVVLQYDSDDKLCKLLIEVGRLAGKNNLEIDMTERKILSSPIQDLIKKHKDKYQL